MTKTETEILRALEAGPATVPEIAERLGWGRWGRACAYPAARELVRRGLLAEHEEPGGPERGGRPRFVYGLRAPRPGARRTRT